MKNLIIAAISMLFFTHYSEAQTTVYSSFNGHSHNDYEQKHPFKTAFNAKMGSIEADIFLIGNRLFVAHDEKALKPKNTLEALYLAPLVKAIRKQKAYPLQILIDVKSKATDSTLEEFMRELAHYPDVFNDKSLVKFVISGHRPTPDKWIKYPNYIQFDGRPFENYTAEEWAHIGLVSESFKNFTHKKGEDLSDSEAISKMKLVIEKVHAQGKKIRFWDTPDTQESWAILKNLGVDFINTDMPKALAAFFKK